MLVLVWFIVFLFEVISLYVVLSFRFSSEIVSRFQHWLRGLQGEPTSTLIEGERSWLTEGIWCWFHFDLLFSCLKWSVLYVARFSNFSSTTFSRFLLPSMDTLSGSSLVKTAAEIFGPWLWFAVPAWGPGYGSHPSANELPLFGTNTGCLRFRDVLLQAMLVILLTTRKPIDFS